MSVTIMNRNHACLTVLLIYFAYQCGFYAISLSQLVRWLGTKAEELGVEIYPGFAASEVAMFAFMESKLLDVSSNHN